MPLAAACKELFQAHIRSRGEEYFHSGRVGKPIVDQAEDRAHFSVRGSRRYAVLIDWHDVFDDGVVRFECDCPYYSDGLPCKHLWAAIRKFDSEGLSDSLIPLADSIEPTLEQSDPHDEEYFDPGEYPLLRIVSSQPPPRGAEPSKTSWQRQLETIRWQNRSTAASRPDKNPKNPRSAYFLIDIEETKKTGELVFQFYGQETTKNGKPGSLKYMKVEREDVAFYPDALDKEAMGILLTTGVRANRYSYYSQPQRFGRATFSRDLYSSLLPKLCNAGKVIRYGDRTFENVSFYEGDPWKLELEVEPTNLGYRVIGVFKQGDRIRPISSAHAILRNGLIIFPDALALHDAADHFGWVLAFKENSELILPKEEGNKWVEAFYQDPNPPAIIWPEDLKWAEVVAEPEPLAVFSNGKSFSFNKGILLRISFRYGDSIVSSFESRPFSLEPNLRKILKRNQAKEAEYRELAHSFQLDLPPQRLNTNFNYRLNTRDFVSTVKKLLGLGWKVEAEGKRIQEAESFEIGVSSGIDWLELKGFVAYKDGSTASLPALLSALKRGENMVVLDDGSLGMLPEEWLSKYAPLATFGSQEKDAVRFSKSQALIVDSWLARDNSVQYDAAFSQLAKRLNSVSVARPKEAPKTFKGELRSYQKDGLGWLRFLRESNLGGILADDMGLGKTIQVLAHLEYEKHKSRKETTPSIAIVPKSLVFNWIDEAKRFVPALKLLNYTGTERDISQITSADLILTTYATLRLDLDRLKEIDFYYVILDEAQAIKNRDALTSLACKQLKGRHRLILTGTPVENSLDDLFSLMEFANPGLLGSSTSERLREVTKGGTLNREALDPLARALKPFILRRTKAQVLKDLPGRGLEIQAVGNALSNDASEVESRQTEAAIFNCSDGILCQGGK